MSSRDMSNNENGHDASLVVASVCIIPELTWASLYSCSYLFGPHRRTFYQCNFVARLAEAECC